MESMKDNSRSKIKNSQKKLFYSMLLVSFLFAGKITAALITRSFALFSDS